MNWFEYQYNTPGNIFDNILLMSQLTPIDYGVFWVIIFLYFIFVLYIIPIIEILIKNAIKDHESKKRRNFIKQIAIQKDIEDKIAEEIDVS
jgi:hypothetical protein